jgi:hypothetical protein
MVMLHRMTTLASTFVVAFLAAPVLDAAVSTAALAANNCLATPQGDSPPGSRWLSQTNPITGQKCWIIDAGRAPVRTAALRGFFDPGTSTESAEPATADHCIKAPDDPAPPGKRWSYRRDDATGERCWQLGARPPRIGHAVRARPPPDRSVELEAPAVVLTRGTAEANARLLDKTDLAPPVAEPLGRIIPASSPGPAAPEASDGSSATPAFISRWASLSEQVHSSDRQPNSGIDRSVAAVFRNVANPGRAGDHLFTVERPLHLILFVFIASLGSALLFLGLTGGSFIFRRSSAVERLDLPPLRDAFRVADLDEPSDPSPPARPTPIHASSTMADGGDQAESDWQSAVDDLLREVGGGQIDLDGPGGQHEAEGDPRLTNPFTALKDRSIK